jgi:hypothetical protein
MLDDLIPSATPAPRPRNHPPVYQRLTEKRWQLFLKALRETGLVRVAAQAASPHLIDPGTNAGGMYAGVATFMREIQRNPTRKAEYEAACDDGQATLERIARERLTIPDRRPVLDRMGKLVANEDRWESANRLLLRTLSKLDSSWSDKREISGSVKHEHEFSESAGGAAYTIRLDDLALLGTSDARELMGLLAKLEDAREAAKLPASDQQPAPDQQRALPGPTSDEVTA